MDRFLSNIGLVRDEVGVVVDSYLAQLKPHVSKDSRKANSAATLWHSTLERLQNELVPFWKRNPPYGGDQCDLPWGVFLRILERTKEMISNSAQSVSHQGDLPHEAQEKLTTLNNLIRELQDGGVSPAPFPLDPSPIASLNGGKFPAWIESINNEDLRKVVQRVWMEAEGAVRAGLPMASTVMRGAVLEAALITLLERELPDSHPKKKGLRKDRLEDLVNTAKSAGVLSGLAVNCADCARITRNLIHPFKLVEKAGDIEEIAALPKLMEAWTEAAASKLEAK